MKNTDSLYGYSASAPSLLNSKCLLLGIRLQLFPLGWRVFPLKENRELGAWPTAQEAFDAYVRSVNHDDV